MFAAALKRVSKEIGRIQKLGARAAHIEAARRALAMRREADEREAACKDRQGVASDEECASRSRRPQQGKSSMRQMRACGLADR